MTTSAAGWRPRCCRTTRRGSRSTRMAVAAWSRSWPCPTRRWSTCTSCPNGSGMGSVAGSSRSPSRADPPAWTCGASRSTPARGGSTSATSSSPCASAMARPTRSGSPTCSIGGAPRAVSFPPIRRMTVAPSRVVRHATARRSRCSAAGPGRPSCSSTAPPPTTPRSASSDRCSPSHTPCTPSTGAAAARRATRCPTRSSASSRMSRRWPTPSRARRATP